MNPSLKTLAVCIVISILAFISMANRSSANEIHSVSLVMDGSLDPPGDLLKFTAFLSGDVRKAHVEVVAYLVSGKGNEKQARIPTGRRQNADGQGRYLLRSDLRRRGRDVDPVAKEGRLGQNRDGAIAAFERSLVISYGDLDIAKGEHLLGYLLKLVVDGEVVLLKPTELTKVTITNETRKKLTASVATFAEAMEESELTANVWRNGRLEPVSISQTKIVKKPVAMAKSIEVAVRGEFRREAAEADTMLASRDFLPEPKRTVYFATNREIADLAGNAETRYGNESVAAIDKMTFGTCTVSIPIDHHKPGRLEQPGTTWLFWRETPDPAKHFLVEGARFGVDPKTFFADLGKDDVLVYVHGYNNSFKDAILRSAQLQHDLEFGGKVVAFSWPSAGATAVVFANPFDVGDGAVKLAYEHDETQASNSTAYLADVLKRLLSEKEGKRVHVLAHSMGNRVLLKALDRLHAEGAFAEGKAKLGQVILAAADIDGSTFSNVRDGLKNACERITFYFATDDGALRLSQALHVDKPIGLGPLFDDKQMDTIDATNITNVFSGMAHLYVTEAKPILTDIRFLLTQQLRPDQRRPPLGPRIEAAELPGRFYWTLAPIR